MRRPRNGKLYKQRRQVIRLRRFHLGYGLLRGGLFLRLCQAHQEARRLRRGYLLLADFDKNDHYKPAKLYSEIYSFNLDNGSTSTYVSNNTRLIDKNGAFRSDWTLLTDDFIANLGDAKYFLSSRYYTSDDKGKRADVMVLSNAYRPKVVVSDILGLWFVNDGNGMHYLKKTANGFVNIVNNGSETVLAEFEGDYFADYLQDGKYLVNKKTLTVTDLLTGGGGHAQRR